MRIETECLRLRYRIGKMICQIVLPDRDGAELCTCLRGHLSGNLALIIFGAVEGQGEGAYRFAVMSRRQAEDRTGVESPAEVTADRNVGAQTDSNGLFQRETELRRPVGIGTLRCIMVSTRIVKIPVLLHLHVLLACDQVVARRNLENSIKERAHLMPASFDGVIDGLGIPTSRHSGGKQGFHFRCEIKRPAVPCVEQGLDAETVTCGEDGSALLIPKHKGELAPQSMQALHAIVFIKMQGDLAVRSRPQPVARLLEFALDCFVLVEFTVDDDAGLSVLAYDRLIPSREIDDAQPACGQGQRGGPTISNGPGRRGRGDEGIA